MEDVEVKVGGEDKPREIFETMDIDGRPILYKVKVKNYRVKPGKPNDQGQPTEFLSWGFEVVDGPHKGKIVYGSTNNEARRKYTGDKKPMKLLLLVIALNGGTEPKKGTLIKLADFVDKTLFVELETKDGAEGAFQVVSRYFPDRKGQPAPTADDTTSNIDNEVGDGVDAPGID